MAHTLTSHSIQTNRPRGCRTRCVKQLCAYVAKHLHIAVEIGVLEDDAGVVAPWPPEIGSACALNHGVVNHIPIGIVTGPAGGGDKSIGYGLWTCGRLFEPRIQKTGLR